MVISSHIPRGTFKNHGSEIHPTDLTMDKISVSRPENRIHNFFWVEISKIVFILEIWIKLGKMSRPGKIGPTFVPSYSMRPDDITWQHPRKCWIDGFKFTYCLIMNRVQQKKFSVEKIIVPMSGSWSDFYLRNPEIPRSSTTSRSQSWMKKYILS